ncbi:MAG TPA: DNA ligase D [Flavitalea sp.]|nr:DNA ligase D [Flavitalea sp.]
MDWKELLKKGKKEQMPLRWAPMLATLTKEPFNNADWTFEIKWDGYRILAYTNENNTILYSRSLLNYTSKYKPVAQALNKLNHKMILDGEVVLLDKTGRPDFDALQRYQGQEGIVFYVFDCLWLNGISIIHLPLHERKKILRSILTESDTIRISEEFEEGTQLFDQVKKLGLEGIMAKKKESVYVPGKRTTDWLKIPTSFRQEFVIGGWTESTSARSFRSLLFGRFQNGQLHFVGHAGGGFKEKNMNDILTKLKKLETNKKSFVNEVDAETKVHWVKPELVAEIKYATWTKGGKIRKPAIFMGFRNDKKAHEVTGETEIIKSPATKITTQKTSVLPGSNWNLIMQEKITSQSKFIIEGSEINIVNVEKEYWKGITKAALIEYYHRIADSILPHLKDRPQSLHIKNKGPLREGFYIKDMEEQQPAFATVFPVKRKHKKTDRREIIDYLVCQDEATLLFMVNLGCIDINPWTSRMQNPSEPDYIVIDLDPSDKDFNKVIETARASNEFFKRKKLKVFPKTSGKSGMHLYIPCRGIAFPHARPLAEYICNEIHGLVPSLTTTEVSVDHRGNLLYIDPNQNDDADTLAAPYSVRPHTIPTVSTPLQWKEINKRLDPHEFTIHTMGDRLDKKGDIFFDVLSEEIAVKNTRELMKLL